MIDPIGVERQSVVTSLGTMMYYTPTQPPWQDNQDTEARSPLVFLHGFGGGSSAYEWSKVYPAFANEYQVLAPDLVGWGRSEHPERNYQPDDYINTIIEFLEKTCNQSTPVVASSLTAALTIRAAIVRPDLFKLLMLTTPAGLADFGEDTRSFFTQLVSTPVVDKLLYNLAIATPNGIRNFLETRQFARPERVYQEIVSAYLESAQQPNAEYAALSFVQGNLSFDLSKFMPQLQTPTAIIWGKESQFTGIEIGKRLAALNPEAVKVFQPLEDVGITPQLEVPEVTIGLIWKYLQQFS